MDGFDSTIIRRAQAGDLPAFAEVVEHFRRFVVGVALDRLGNFEDAQDIAQDVFLRAFTRLDQVRDPNRFGGWLRQIAVNECHAYRLRLQEPTSVWETADSNTAVDNRLMLNNALAAIDEPSRLTVILYYQHAYSLKEIGALLEEPETTIKSRLRNARSKLRRHLEVHLEESLKPDILPTDFGEQIAEVIAAAQLGDAERIRQYLERNPSLAEADRYEGGHSALHVAAASGNAAVVELLLHFGADPNARDTGDNATPLHYAAERGWLDCIKLLVEAGSDVNASDDLHERGPLGWACVFGEVRWPVVEYLLARGARFDVFSAAACGREDEIRRLVEEAPSALTARMSEFERFQSPIAFAAAAGHPEIAQVLADLGAPVGLLEAAALGDERAIAELSWVASDEEKGDALIVAVKGRSHAAARALLEAGAEPDFAPQGLSPMFDAFARADEPMARLLLEFGADLEFRDSQWKATALGWEVFYGRIEGVELGLRLGAVPDPHLLDTARAGERGEWRRYTSATADEYRQVREVLEKQSIGD